LELLGEDECAVQQEKRPLRRKAEKKDDVNPRGVLADYLYHANKGPITCFKQAGATATVVRHP